LVFEKSSTVLVSYSNVPYSKTGIRFLLKG
jgi:hypothetical protein